MANYKTRAIILKRSELGENDRLVTLLSAKRGKIRAVARGAGKPGSRLAGLILPFQHVDLLLWHGRNLDGISQGEVLHPFRPLREDLQRMTWAWLGSECADRFTHEGTEQNFYSLLLTYQRLITTSAVDDLPVCAVWFLLHGLIQIGYGPELNQCSHCGRPFQPTIKRQNVSKRGSEEDTIAFDPRGGIVCPVCATSLPPSGRLLLSRAAVSFMRYLRQAPINTLTRVKKPVDFHALFTALEHFLRWNLELHLHTFDFMAQMNSIRASNDPIDERNAADHP